MLDDDHDVTKSVHTAQASSLKPPINCMIEYIAFSLIYCSDVLVSKFANTRSWMPSPRSALRQRSSLMQCTYYTSIGLEPAHHKREAKVLPVDCRYFLINITVVSHNRNVMQCSLMWCNAMQCNAMHFAIQYNTFCNTIQCNAMQCNAMQWNAMQCNAIQCNAMQCNAMQYNTIQYNIQCNAICIAMQCNACNAMHCIALHCNAMYMHRPGTPCLTETIGQHRHFVISKDHHAADCSTRFSTMEVWFNYLYSVFS